MELIKSVNVGIRFLLELCFLVIFGYWGFRMGENSLMKILLGLGSFVLVSAVWGAFLAPKSHMRLHGPWLLLLEIAIFGLAVWTLYHTGSVPSATTFGVVYLLNKILMMIWRQ